MYLSIFVISIHPAQYEITTTHRRRAKEGEVEPTNQRKEFIWVVFIWCYLIKWTEYDKKERTWLIRAAMKWNKQMELKNSVTRSKIQFNLPSHEQRTQLLRSLDWRWSACVTRLHTLLYIIYFIYFIYQITRSLFNHTTSIFTFRRRKFLVRNVCCSNIERKQKQNRKVSQFGIAVRVDRFSLLVFMSPLLLMAMFCLKWNRFSLSLFRSACICICFNGSFSTLNSFAYSIQNKPFRCRATNCSNTCNYFYCTCAVDIFDFTKLFLIRCTYGQTSHMPYEINGCHIELMALQWNRIRLSMLSLHYPIVN